MKRKQPDFQKTKLKVGRQLPKGRNVTDTSFKTKKIITRDQLKSVLGESSLKELFNILASSNNNANVKIETLHKIKNYILEKKASLLLYFPDILKKLGVVLLESDPKVRETAIEAISTCIKLLSEVQLRTFFTQLTTYLSCMMTHVSTSVRKDSLKLLEVLLKFHPKVICNSTKVLQNLLNMISSKRKGMKCRKLDDLIIKTMTARDWRMWVLHFMQLFLQAMLQKSEKEPEDERKVFWDGQKPLYLPLYINGGTQPVQLDYSWASDSNAENNISEFRNFIYDLVPVLSDALRGEIPSTQTRNSDHTFNILNPDLVSYLNVIAQVLCCVGECIQLDLDLKDNIDMVFSLQLKNVSLQLIKSFPYAQHDPLLGKKRQPQAESECLQLNLSICYLYTMFIHDTRDIKTEKTIFNYLSEVFRVSNKMCSKSVSLILKMSKILLHSQQVNTSYKNGILHGLYDILDTHKLTPVAKPIYSFFVEISLDYEFKYLLDSEGMVMWFKVLFKELEFMLDSGLIDEQFLKYIKQVCSRKYRPFMDLLNKVKDETLINFLKYNNEEFQSTISHLIVSLDNLTSGFLRDVAEAISEDSFSLKIAVQLVRLLHLKFSRRDASEIEKVIFVKFLLNLGCDSKSIEEPIKTESTPLTELLSDVHQNCQYQIYPTHVWERHQKILEVCAECLMPYGESEAVREGIRMFFKSILIEFPKYPVHSVISLLQLRNKVHYFYEDEHVVSMFYELTLSSLYYISVISNVPSADLSLYCIPQLQSSFNLMINDTAHLFAIIEDSLSYNENELFYLLRIFMFLSKKQLLTTKDSETVYEFLEKTAQVCQHSNSLFPIWRTVCEYWNCW